MLPALADAIDLFAATEDSSRLELLIEFGERLPVLQETYHHLRDTGQHMIHECQSPVFMFADVQQDTLRIHADVPREAPIARGFVALLSEVFDGVDAAEVKSAPVDLLGALGIRDLLTLQRRRGLSAIYSHLLREADRTAPPHITAIVLAAGPSRRMVSHNKLLLDFRGRPLVAHVVETVLAAGLGDVVVVLGHEAHEVRRVLESYPVTFVHNDRYAEGMGTSIQVGVNSAPPDTSGYMICLADLPLIEPAELQVLTSAFATSFEPDARRIIVPYHAGQSGNPVIFQSDFKPEILAHKGPAGCRSIVERHRDSVVAVEMKTNHVLVDVDTLETYENLVSREGAAH